jgi:DNA-damage-inducible protein D
MFFFDSNENNSFEEIRHIDENGSEFWYARELQGVLGYSKWQNFEQIVEKAKEACKNSGISTSVCFTDVSKTSSMPNGGLKEISDIKLSRYACYLIAQNGDSRKESIALAQTYFAVQTRRQELQDKFNQLTEAQRRLAIRSELTEHNKSLVEAAQQAGVETPQEFAVFQNRGYQGLYGGLGAKEIHTRKGLKKNQHILDHMGSEELAANLFRATQTDAKLRRDNIQGKSAANETHYAVGSKVRQTIQELGGTMPEDLPTPDKSIKELQKSENPKLETDAPQSM